jgi:hypothetical protein
MAVAVVPATLEAAIAIHVQDKLDRDAGGDHGTNQRTTVASQVLGDTALDVTVQCHTDVVLDAVRVAVVGAVEAAAEMEQVR